MSWGPVEHVRIECGALGCPCLLSPSLLNASLLNAPADREPLKPPPPETLERIMAHDDEVDSTYVCMSVLSYERSVTPDAAATEETHEACCVPA